MSFLVFSLYAANGANSPDVSTRMPKTERPICAVHSVALYHPSLPNFLQEFLAPMDPVDPTELFSLPHTESCESQSRQTTILAPFVPWSVKLTKSRSSIISWTVSTKSKKSHRGAHTRSLVDLNIAGLLEEASQQPAATPHTVTPVPTSSVPL